MKKDKFTITVLLTLFVFYVRLDAQEVHHAIDRLDSAEVKLILKKNPELLNDKAGTGIAPLHLAVHKDNKIFVNLLLETGADINIKDNSFEWTPLHWALSRNHCKIAELLIDRGADLNIKDNAGKIPLQIAVENGYTEIAARILDKCGGLNFRDKHFKRTLLHTAAIKGYNSIVKILIGKGAEINPADKYGKTPLYYAGYYGHKQTAELLLQSGATIKSFEKNYGFSPYLKKDIRENEAFIWYLGHSGWALKTKEHLLIFDYWECGKNPFEPLLSNGHINPLEIENLKVRVFVTHKHKDHFDPVIFQWDNTISDIFYIFGWEFNKNIQSKHLTATHNMSKTVDDMIISSVKKFPSIVPEAAYLIKVDGLVLYFAGDYGGNFEDGIDYLAGKQGYIDIAFVLAYGGKTDVSFYAIEKLMPKIVFPMHAEGREFVYKEFAGKVKEKNPNTKVICAENRGDRYFYNNGKINDQ